jgi:preprotein translocase SecF subunit
MTIPYSIRHSADEVERKLAQINSKYKESRAVVAGESGGQEYPVIITTPKLSSDDERKQVLNALTDSGRDLAPKVDPTGKRVPRTVEDVAYSNVSGVISSELTQNAFLAILLSSLCIVFYLAVRFAIGGFMEGLKYGICAVIALLHDVLVVWGAFAILGYLFNWQIDSLFVTAMLTVIGFSVHDTIIIFDRIRENLQHRQRGENFSDLTDRSIDQTIARSVNTSFTVVLTLLALFFFGGGIIHQFIGALLIGIVSGTYSSIFNASVLLVMWKQRDTGLALPGSGAASGPKSRLSARPEAVLPGDRPLVTPPKTGGGNLSNRPPAPNRAESEEESADEGEAPTKTPSVSRPGVHRPKPIRRRRM